jgi:hypothetical protein
MRNKFNIVIVVHTRRFGVLVASPDESLCRWIGGGGGGVTVAAAGSPPRSTEDAARSTSCEAISLWQWWAPL